MLKWFRRIILFLLPGAIVNLAVAWGLTFKATDFNGEMSVFRSHPDNPTWIGCSIRRFGVEQLVVWDHPPAPDWINSPVMTRQWSIVRDRPPTAMGSTISEDDFWIEYAHGWPWLSMVGRLRIDENIIEESTWAVPATQSNVFNADDRLVPLHPIWPGFIINTICFGMAGWFVFGAPFAIRRLLRYRQGSCLICGYPRGTSFVCTECGEPLSNPDRR